MTRSHKISLDALKSTATPNDAPSELKGVTNPTETVVVVEGDETPSSWTRIISYIGGGLVVCAAVAAAVFVMANKSASA